MESSMSEQENFLKPLLQLMQDNADRQDKRMNGIEAKLDANTKELGTNTFTTNQTLKQLKSINGRLTRAEKNIANMQARKSVGSLFSSINPSVIYIIAVGAVILLAIVATSMHISIQGLL